MIGMAVVRYLELKGVSYDRYIVQIIKRKKDRG